MAIINCLRSGTGAGPSKPLSTLLINYDMRDFKNLRIYDTNNNVVWDDGIFISGYEAGLTPGSSYILEAILDSREYGLNIQETTVARTRSLNVRNIYFYPEDEMRYEFIANIENTFTLNVMQAMFDTRTLDMELIDVFTCYDLEDNVVYDGLTNSYSDLYHKGLIPDSEYILKIEGSRRLSAITINGNTIEPMFNYEIGEIFFDDITFIAEKGINAVTAIVEPLQYTQLQVIGDDETLGLEIFTEIKGVEYIVYANGSLTPDFSNGLPNDRTYSLRYLQEEEYKVYTTISVKYEDGYLDTAEMTTVGKFDAIKLPWGPELIIEIDTIVPIDALLETSLTLNFDRNLIKDIKVYPESYVYKPTAAGDLYMLRMSNSSIYDYEKGIFLTPLYFNEMYRVEIPNDGVADGYTVRELIINGQSNSSNSFNSIFTASRDNYAEVRTTRYSVTNLNVFSPAAFRIRTANYTEVYGSTYEFDPITGMGKEVWGWLPPYKGLIEGEVYYLSRGSVSPASSMSNYSVTINGHTIDYTISSNQWSSYEFVAQAVNNINTTLLTVQIPNSNNGVPVSITYDSYFNPEIIETMSGGVIWAGGRSLTNNPRYALVNGNQYTLRLNASNANSRVFRAKYNGQEIAIDTMSYVIQFTAQTQNNFELTSEQLYTRDISYNYMNYTPYPVDNVKFELVEEMGRNVMWDSVNGFNEELYPNGLPIGSYALMRLTYETTGPVMAHVIAGYTDTYLAPDSNIMYSLNISEMNTISITMEDVSNYTQDIVLKSNNLQAISSISIYKFDSWESVGNYYSWETPADATEGKFNINGIGGEIGTRCWLSMSYSSSISQVRVNGEIINMTVEGNSSSSRYYFNLQAHTEIEITLDSSAVIVEKSTLNLQYNPFINLLYITDEFGNELYDGFKWRMPSQDYLTTYSNYQFRIVSNLLSEHRMINTPDASYIDDMLDVSYGFVAPPEVNLNIAYFNYINNEEWLPFNVVTNSEMMLKRLNRHIYINTFDGMHYISVGWWKRGRMIYANAQDGNSYQGLIRGTAYRLFIDAPAEIPYTLTMGDIVNNNYSGYTDFEFIAEDAYTLNIQFNEVQEVNILDEDNLGLSVVIREASNYVNLWENGELLTDEHLFEGIYYAIRVQTASGDILKKVILNGEQYTADRDGYIYAYLSQVNNIELPMIPIEGYIFPQFTGEYANIDIFRYIDEQHTQREYVCQDRVLLPEYKRGLPPDKGPYYFEVYTAQDQRIQLTVGTDRYSTTAYTFMEGIMEPVEIPPYLTGVVTFNVINSSMIGAPSILNLYSPLINLESISIVLIEYPNTYYSRVIYTSSKFYEIEPGFIADYQKYGLIPGQEYGIIVTTNNGSNVPYIGSMYSADITVNEVYLGENQVQAFATGDSTRMLTFVATASNNITVEWWDANIPNGLPAAGIHLEYDHELFNPVIGSGTDFFRVYIGDYPTNGSATETLVYRDYTYNLLFQPKQPVDITYTINGNTSQFDSNSTSRVDLANLLDMNYISIYGTKKRISNVVIEGNPGFVSAFDFRVYYDEACTDLAYSSYSGYSDPRGLFMGDTVYIQPTCDAAYNYIVELDPNDYNSVYMKAGSSKEWVIPTNNRDNTWYVRLNITDASQYISSLTFSLNKFSIEDCYVSIRDANYSTVWNNYEYGPDSFIPMVVGESYYLMFDYYNQSDPWHASSIALNGIAINKDINSYDWPFTASSVNNFTVTLSEGWGDNMGPSQDGSVTDIFVQVSGADRFNYDIWLETMDGEIVWDKNGFQNGYTSLPYYEAFALYARATGFNGEEGYAYVKQDYSSYIFGPNYPESYTTSYYNPSIIFEIQLSAITEWGKVRLIKPTPWMWVNTYEVRGSEDGNTYWMSGSQEYPRTGVGLKIGDSYDFVLRFPEIPYPYWVTHNGNPLTRKAFDRYAEPYPFIAEAENNFEIVYIQPVPTTVTYSWDIDSSKFASYMVIDPQTGAEVTKLTPGNTYDISFSTNAGFYAESLTIDGVQQAFWVAGGIWGATVSFTAPSNNFTIGLYLVSVSFSWDVDSSKFAYYRVVDAQTGNEVYEVTPEGAYNVEFETYAGFYVESLTIDGVQQAFWDAGGISNASVSFYAPSYHFMIGLHGVQYTTNTFNYTAADINEIELAEPYEEEPGAWVHLAEGDALNSTQLTVGTEYRIMLIANTNVLITQVSYNGNILWSGTHTSSDGNLFVTFTAVENGVFEVTTLAPSPYTTEYNTDQIDSVEVVTLDGVTVDALIPGESYRVIVTCKPEYTTTYIHVNGTLIYSYNSDIREWSGDTTFTAINSINTISIVANYIFVPVAVYDEEAIESFELVQEDGSPTPSVFESGLRLKVHAVAKEGYDVTSIKLNNYEIYTYTQHASCIGMDISTFVYDNHIVSIEITTAPILTDYKVINFEVSNISAIVMDLYNSDSGHTYYGLCRNNPIFKYTDEMIADKYIDVDVYANTGYGINVFTVNGIDREPAGRNVVGRGIKNQLTGDNDIIILHAVEFTENTFIANNASLIASKIEGFGNYFTGTRTAQVCLGLTYPVHAKPDSGYTISEVLYNGTPLTTYINSVGLLTVDMTVVENGVLEVIAEKIPITYTPTYDENAVESIAIVDVSSGATVTELEANHQYRVDVTTNEGYELRLITMNGTQIYKYDPWNNSVSGGGRFTCPDSSFALEITTVAAVDVNIDYDETAIEYVTFSRRTGTSNPITPSSYYYPDETYNLIVIPKTGNAVTEILINGEQKLTFDPTTGRGSNSANTVKLATDTTISITTTAIENVASINFVFTEKENPHPNGAVEATFYYRDSNIPIHNLNNIVPGVWVKAVIDTGFDNNSVHYHATSLTFDDPDWMSVSGMNSSYVSAQLSLREAKTYTLALEMVPELTCTIENISHVGTKDLESISVTNISGSTVSRYQPNTQYKVVAIPKLGYSVLKIAVDGTEIYNYNPDTGEASGDCTFTTGTSLFHIQVYTSLNNSGDVGSDTQYTTNTFNIEHCAANLHRDVEGAWVYVHVPDGFDNVQIAVGDRYNLELYPHESYAITEVVYNNVCIWSGYHTDIYTAVSIDFTAVENGVFEVTTSLYKVINFEVSNIQSVQLKLYNLDTNDYYYLDMNNPVFKYTDDLVADKYISVTATAITGYGINVFTVNDIDRNTWGWNYAIRDIKEQLTGDNDIVTISAIELTENTFITNNASIQTGEIQEFGVFVTGTLTAQLCPGLTHSLHVKANDSYAISEVLYNGTPLDFTDSNDDMSFVMVDMTVVENGVFEVITTAATPTIYTPQVTTSNCNYMFTDINGNDVAQFDYETMESTINLTEGETYTLYIMPVPGYGNHVITFNGTTVSSPYTFTVEEQPVINITSEQLSTTEISINFDSGASSAYLDHMHYTGRPMGASAMPPYYQYTNYFVVANLNEGYEVAYITDNYGNTYSIDSPINTGDHTNIVLTVTTQPIQTAQASYAANDFVGSE